MTKFTHWLRTLLSDTFSRTIATLVTGALVPIVLAILSIGLSRFLLQTVTVPLGLVIILVLFASVGLIAGAVPLWELVSIRRKQPRDEPLENATSSLLTRLSEIETGRRIHVEAEVHAYHASTLGLFDQWEISLALHLPAADFEAIRALRAEIAGRSLQHSRQEAGQWVLQVKEWSSKAREKPIRHIR